MAVIEHLGEQTGLWDTTIRTDTEVLTKKKLEFNAKNLNNFDAILMFTGGDLEMDAQQKADFLSFIHDDGKGLIGVHSAAITWVKWPEFVDMLGGDFDEHPWLTFDAPIIVEDPAFPGMQQWPHEFVLHDEIYQMKDFSRDKVRVLMRLDPCKLDLRTPRCIGRIMILPFLGKVLWQRPGLLLDPRAPERQLGRSPAAEDVHRGNQVGNGIGVR